MEEYKKQMVLLCVFIVILGIFLIIYKSDLFLNFAQGLPLHSDSQNCIKLNSGVCLSEDAGLRVNYYEASSYCRKKGMRLPSREDAWLIWTDSENCHRAFASNLEIPKDKIAFINSCEEDECIAFASNIKSYCTIKPSIKFPRASQYQNGLFWLKDSAGEGKHYAINYSTGRIYSVKDTEDVLGIRCIAVP